MLKLLSFIVFLLFITSSQVLGQSTISLEDLRNSSSLYTYERNPELLKYIKLSEELTEGRDSLSPSYSYFVDCVVAMQENDFILDQKVADRLLNADYNNICSSGDKLDKSYCAKRLKSMEDVILSYLFYQNFQQDLVDKYCEHHYYKEVTVWEEYCKFGNSIGVQFCVNDNIMIMSHPWSDPPNFIMHKIVRYECPILNRSKMPFNSFAQGMISNAVADMAASEIIQNYFTYKIEQKLDNDNTFEKAQIEMRVFLKDFRKKGELQSSEHYSFYSFTRQICGIDFSLNSFWPAPGNLSKKQKRRFKNGKPFKTKREIIRQFKSTKYYKMIKLGKS